MHTAYITHPEFLKHDMGPDHPECPARIYAVADQLIASGILDYLNHFEATKATKEVLALAHTQEYIDWVFSRSPESGLVDLDGDTLMNPYTLDAALYASGAVIQAVDLVMANEVQNAFCNIRPPGHHAKRAGASGFCIFNNVAVAAAYALERYGLERVAIVDFDVHHGDGTEDIFHDDPRVMFCSTFQHPYYPIAVQIVVTTISSMCHLLQALLVSNFVKLLPNIGCPRLNVSIHRWSLSLQVLMRIGKTI